MFGTGLQLFIVAKLEDRPAYTELTQYTAPVYLDLMKLVFTRFALYNAN